MEKNLSSERPPGKRLALVIVTYNRCDDLSITLTTLAGMQSEFDYLVVVDNASTDNTGEVVAAMVKVFAEKLILETSDTNLGGAGGFHLGAGVAARLPVDWIWMSDDDALPQPNCLHALLSAADSPDNVYGGVAVAKDSNTEELCWPASVATRPGDAYRVVNHRSDLEPSQEVLLLPFLGLMVSRKKLREAGLPNKTYFISGDDAEFCIRLRKSGARIIQVRDSVVTHPPIPRYRVKLFSKEFSCLTLMPWRRYYEVRNRIWNARQRSGLGGAVTSTATHLLRLVLTYIFEDNLKGQAGAYLRGIKDGLLSSPGKVQYLAD